MEVMMQNVNILNTLKCTSLFSGVDEKRINDTIAASAVCDYSKGDDITSDKPALYVVVRGCVNVYRTEGGQTVILNTIKEGGVFGAAQLFCSDPAFSSVRASNSCCCLRIPRVAVTRLLEDDFVFAENYVSFLSDRIRFLNKKIASFTAGNGEKTLAEYLLSVSADNNTVRLGQSVSNLALSLNLSRPTLYRAFISLEKQGMIEKDGKAVKIISKEKLKTI